VKIRKPLFGCPSIAGQGLSLGHKWEDLVGAKSLILLAYFELAWAMLEIARAECQTFKPVAPFVRSGERSLHRRFISGFGRDSDRRAGSGHDFGDGAPQPAGRENFHGHQQPIFHWNSPFACGFNRPKSWSGTIRIKSQG
jgi:hypothetical protein